MMSSSNNPITKGLILKLSSNQDAYLRGESIYKDGKITAFDISEKDDITIQAIVKGNYKNYKVVVKLDRAKSLESYSCSCQSHSIWRGACKHVIAVLIARLEGGFNIFSVERMEQQAKDLNEKLEGIIFDAIDQEMLDMMLENVTSNTGIKLVPTIHSDPSGIYLTFSIGTNRMYVIKSIQTLVEDIKIGREVTYGLGLKTTHKLETFDPLSQKLIQFILDEDILYGEVAKQLRRQLQYTQQSLNAGRKMYLTPANIDPFFNIFLNREVAIESVVDRSILFVDAMPDFSMAIKYNTDGTTIKAEVKADGIKCKFIHGKNFSYILTADKLHRVDSASGRILNLLLDSLKETPGGEILLTGASQEKFVTTLLPHLKRIDLVSSIEGDMPQVGLSPLVTNLYFDNHKKDISCRVDFVYGETVINATTGTTNVNVNRDIMAEYRIRRMLQALGFVDDKKISAMRLKGDDLIYTLLYEEGTMAPLAEVANIYVSDDLEKRSAKAPSPKVGVRIAGNLLSITLDDTKYNFAELLEAMEAYKLKKKYHRLKDGRFIAIEDREINSAIKLLDEFDITSKELKKDSISIPVYHSLYADNVLDNLRDTHAINMDDSFQALIDSFKGDNNLNFKIPAGLKSILREYQKSGFYWLKTLSHYGFGGILSDDMGLGKTLQLISILASTKSKKPSIVVCPTSLIYNWQNEIKKFAPKINALVVSGLPEKRHELLTEKNIDVFITTYELLKRDIPFYENMTFEYIVADEAQNIKNPGTQSAKALKELSGRVRFALTGTPIENTLTELWSIFDFIMPGYLGSSYKFGKVYEVPIVKQGDMAVAEKLRNQISPFVLRRVKESVLTELPEKTETTLVAELSPEQDKIYQATVLETIGAFDDMVAQDTFRNNKIRILAQLTRLRQICCHPELFLDTYSGGSGKLDLALETIQLSVESGHRVLLFSQFTSMLYIIQRAIRQQKLVKPNGKPLEYFYLDGSVKAKERMEMVDKFNGGQGELFLISLKAGGTGLNLTGADVVIHYDPWWNPSVMDQASDRAHRYGQKNAVQVFNLVAKDTIEEKIMALQNKKRDLIDSVIKEGASFINQLSEDEVRKLFSH